MATRARKPGPVPTGVAPEGEVDAFLRVLDHPHKAAIEALRRIILGADPRIAEGIKWKAQSFRTSEYFATVNLRAKAGIGVILHLGAKVRELGPGGLRIADPTGSLRWLAPDRAMVEFADLAAVEARRRDFEALVRQWVAWV